MEFCADNSLCVTNTFFLKPEKHQFTFREPGVDHAPPWTPDRFAQLDFMLSPVQWKTVSKMYLSTQSVAFSRTTI